LATNYTYVTNKFRMNYYSPAVNRDFVHRYRQINTNNKLEFWVLAQLKDILIG